MSARKWTSIGISREVYVSSDGHYHLELYLKGNDKRVPFDYSDGYWLYGNSRDFREFTPPAYVVAMFTAKFAEMHAAGAFTFYEYRNIGGTLVKDDDPTSLRYHDAETWQWTADSIMSDERHGAM